VVKVVCPSQIWLDPDKAIWIPRHSQEKPGSAECLLTTQFKLHYAQMKTGPVFLLGVEIKFIPSYFILA